MSTQQAKRKITINIRKNKPQTLKQLRISLGIEFKNQELLKNAFIHRSYLNEHKDYKLPSNERLEFLGDAVLSIVVSQFLFQKLPSSPEGELTQLRAALVRTETLAKIARNLNLGDYLYLSKGEEESDGRNNNSTLADTFEALIGAIYLDRDFAKAENFISDYMLKKWKSLAESSVSDNKSRLQEIMQRKFKISPTYKLLSSWGPDHSRLFEMGVYMKEKILGKGQGKNKQQAAQNAAKNAIGNLNK